LIVAAAAKAVSNLRLKPTHSEGSGEAKSHTHPDSSPARDTGQPPVSTHAAHGDRGDPDSSDGNERLLTAAQVKRRYGNCSDMWLWRRLHDESRFPEPLMICGRRFWRVGALIAWERSRAKGAA
jgi:predicted DNA-binding transcriptional regulator AlpA